MSNNITIHLTNCGCGCGGSSGSSSPPVYQPPIYNTPGDPSSPSGPPDGYSVPSGLSDRQCKMAVWIYGWIDEWIGWLGTTTEGKLMLYASNPIKKSATLVTAGPIVSAGITAIITFLAIPEPTDVVKTALVYTVASAYVAAIGKVDAELTQPFVADSISYLQSSQSDIICALSKSTSANDASQRLNKALTASGMSDDQVAFIGGIMPTALLTMLFFSADWWPSFDDDALAGITATCCGDYTDGDPVISGSLQHCQASYYVVDMLALTFEKTTAGFGLWVGDVLLYNNDKPYIRQWLAENLDIPAKVKERAADYNAFIWSVAEIVYNSTWGLGGGIAVDPGFDDLASYITTNRAALVALVQAEADINDAYTALKADLDAWVTANIGASYQDNFIAAIDALIKPVNEPYLLDLLYTQDSDLLLYAGADCVDYCPEFGTAYTVIDRNLTSTTIESGLGDGSDFCYASLGTTDVNASGGDTGPWGPYCGGTFDYRVELVSGTVSHYGTRDDAGDIIVATWTPWDGSGPLIISGDRHFFSRGPTFRYQLKFTRL